MKELRRLLDELGGGLDAVEVVARAERWGVRPLRALIRLGVTLDALEMAAWSLLGFRRVDLDPATVDRQTLRSLPVDVCVRGAAVAVERRGPVVVVAVADPTDVEAVDLIRERLGQFEVVAAARESIEEAVRRYQAGEMMGTLDPAAPAADPRPPSLAVDPDDASLPTRLVAATVTYAVNAKASDIHVYGDDKGAEIRIRIDGVLHPYTSVRGVAAAAGVLSRIKVLGGLDLGQRRLPQDGRIQVGVEDRVVDIRVVTIPNAWGGEDAVLRILDASAAHVAIDALGLSAAARGRWERVWAVSHGLVLVVGPTGSGKSTTLYATLRQLATADRAVRTVEDPVEVRLRGITQVQVNPRAGLTFAAALRSFLRADPDVILVGEIRDEETARVATEAAITGHLVLATLHTPSASEVPLRLIEMGVPDYLVAAAVRGAMAQRLIRRLCADCSRPVDAGVREAVPGGCVRCAHTGYRGRTAVAEVMEVDETIRRAIGASASVDEIAELAARSGMRPLADAAMDLVRAGVTSLAERSRAMAVGS